MRLALDADEQTMRSMQVTSKIHHSKFDEGFFKRRLQLKYPSTLNYKPHNMSFKRYYLEVVHAIAQLWEKYQFPYIPVKSFNVVKFYRDISGLAAGTMPRHMLDTLISNTGLLQAVELGDINLVNYFLERGATRFIEALNIAFANGNTELINRFKDQALIQAAISGYIVTVRSVVEKGATNFVEALEFATSDTVRNYLQGLMNGA